MSGLSSWDRRDRPQDAMNLPAGGIDPVRGIHHEMRASPFFCIRHLPRENQSELCRSHPLPGENAGLLNERRRPNASARPSSDGELAPAAAHEGVVASDV